jgi:DNA-binding CsgD family transcriptional regulator/PAS domain-containing protein
VTSARRLSNLIHEIYAAAEDDGQWPGFLATLADHAGSGMTLLIAVDRHDVSANVFATARADPEAVRLYNAEWSVRDPWLTSGHESLTHEGAVVFGHEMIADRELVTTSFYNEFGRRYDLLRTVNATVIADGRTAAGIICHYGLRRRRVPDSVAGLLHLLVPHVARALRFHRAWRHDRFCERAARQAMDRTGRGFVLLDARGRIIRANGAAETILGRADGLTRRADRIGAVVQEDRARLLTAVARAASTALRDGIDSGTTLVVTRRDARRPYVVVVVPISGAGTLFLREGGAAMLVITDPDVAPSADFTGFRDMFGWTRAEADVARLLAVGLQPAAIAERRRVSLLTVRSQIKSLFQKSGVSSRGELIALMLTSNPM